MVDLKPFFTGLFDQHMGALHTGSSTAFYAFDVMHTQAEVAGVLQELAEHCRVGDGLSDFPERFGDWGEAL